MSQSQRQPTPPSVLAVLKALPGWLKDNLRPVLISVVISAAVGFLINVYLMARKYDGYYVPAGSPAAGEANLLNGTLFWMIGASVVVGIFTYWRAVGSERFWREVRAFPKTISTLFKSDGGGAWTHLLWGAAAAFIASRLLVYGWLGLAVSFGLLAALPSLLGRILAGLIYRVWWAVLSRLAPKAVANANVGSMAVAIIGVGAALVLSFFITIPNVKMLLAIACGVGAVLIGRGKTSPATTSAIIGAAVAAGALLFSEPAFADDGGWAECGAQFSSWLQCGSGTGRVISLSVRASLFTGAGAAFGAFLGNVGAGVAMDETDEGWEALLRPPGPSPYSAMEIMNVQAALTDAGLDPGPQDGNLGPRTLTAIKGYQGKQGIPVTGVLDAATLAALGIAVAKGAEPDVAESEIPEPERAEPELAGRETGSGLLLPLPVGELVTTSRIGLRGRGTGSPMRGTSEYTSTELAVVGDALGVNTFPGITGVLSGVGLPQEREDARRALVTRGILQTRDGGSDISQPHITLFDTVLGPDAVLTVKHQSGLEIETRFFYQGDLGVEQSSGAPGLHKFYVTEPEGVPGLVTAFVGLSNGRAPIAGEFTATVDALSRADEAARSGDRETTSRSLSPEASAFVDALLQRTSSTWMRVVRRRGEKAFAVQLTWLNSGERGLWLMQRDGEQVTVSSVTQGWLLGQLGSSG